MTDSAVATRWVWGAQDLVRGKILDRMNKLAKTDAERGYQETVHVNEAIRQFYALKIEMLELL